MDETGGNMRAALAAIAILWSASWTAGAQVQRVEGEVYSYVRADGDRYYASNKPPSGTEFRTIKYSYYEGPMAREPLIFRCKWGDEEVFLSKPFIGCVVVGTAQRPPGTFGGYECREDCSGHQAGYDWALSRGISSTDRCSGSSQSFVEGCLAKVTGYKP